MVNPVDKLRKQQQKKLLLKQKKERQERNRNKFKNQSRGDVQSELDRLQRKPKSMVNAKDEQKMKSLERLLEEKKDDDDKNAAANIGPTIKGPKDIGVGVTYDDYVGDAARDVRDSVYYHPTLNPLGKPPPGKPQKYVQRKRSGKVDVGMALPAPEKKKRKRDGEKGGSSSCLLYTSPSPRD